MSDNKRPWSPPQIILSAVIAIVVWSAVGFSWFGHGFNWSTAASAKRMSTGDIAEQLATICVAQARGSADADAEMKKLSALQVWERRKFIEDAEWAIMPGSDDEQSGVADLCAAKLLAT